MKLLIVILFLPFVTVILILLGALPRDTFNNLFTIIIAIGDFLRNLFSK